jgi:hypothetical protein
MQGIFISYRRQDSQSAAGRLADHVKENLSNVPLFRDVETIEPGVDFSDAINRALHSCGVLLAVIGPHWLTVTDAAGKRRLDHPGDYTRLEVATALARPNVRVIPVLVEGAQMPDANDLPDDLKALCTRNAVELTDKRWNYDVAQLVDAVRRVLDIAPPKPDPAPPTALPWYRRLSNKQWGGIAAAVVVLGIIGQFQPEPVQPNSAPPAAPINPYVQPAPMPAPLAAAASLAGEWHDAQGGRYRLIEQGGRYAFDSAQGQSGVGWIANNMLMLDYTYNGMRYGAQLAISPDGNTLSGEYRSAVNGDYGPVLLQRNL